MYGEDWIYHQDTEKTELGSEPERTDGAEKPTWILCFELRVLWVLAAHSLCALSDFFSLSLLK
jgi:hypothetical protein